MHCWHNRPALTGSFVGTGLSVKSCFVNLQPLDGPLLRFSSPPRRLLLESLLNSRTFFPVRCPVLSLILEHVRLAVRLLLLGREFRALRLRLWAKAGVAKGVTLTAGLVAHMSVLERERLNRQIPVAIAALHVSSSGLG